MKLVECFLFYNELDMLYFHLATLYDVIDAFVLVESRHTFRGNPKELFFEQNKHLFAPFLDKIVHVVVDVEPDADAWRNEERQRCHMVNGLDRLQLEDDDLVFITDVDEVLNPEFIRVVRSQAVLAKTSTYRVLLDSTWHIPIEMYWYSVESKDQRIWLFVVMFSYGQLKGPHNNNPHRVRLKMGGGVYPPITYDGATNTHTNKPNGWHFTYFGDIRFIQNKLQQFSHSEYSGIEFTDTTTIQAHIDAHTPLFDIQSGLHKIPLESNDRLPPPVKLPSGAFFPYTPRVKQKAMEFDTSKYKLTHDWFTHSALRCKLAHFVNPYAPHRILEIGSYEGLSACFFSDLFLDHAESVLHCVDPFDLADPTTPLNNQTETNFLHNLRASKHGTKCLLFRMYSHQFFGTTRDDPTYDIIYIDGSHLYDDALNDAESAFKLLTSGGIMWFDDYGDESRDVGRAIRTFCERHKDELQIIHTSYQFAIRKNW